MIIKNKNTFNAKEHYLNLFTKIKTKHLLLEAIHTKGQELFELLEFPTRKTEAWKYTNVLPILTTNFDIFPDSSVDIPEEKIKSYLIDDAYNLVFINGVFSEKYSSKKSADKVLFNSLSKEMDHNYDFIFKYLSDISKIDDSFSALNTAMFSDGAFIVIPENEIIPKPINIVFATSEVDRKLIQPRNLFYVGENSNANIIVNYIDFQNTNAVNFTNANLEIILAQNANLNFYKFQNANKNNFHIDKINVAQNKNSVFNSFVFSFGGDISRTEVLSKHLEENVETNYYGLYIANDNQHIDNFTLIDHATPNCTSNEIYKGILADKATGVFSGKVLVRENAQHTNAYQSNKTILLSKEAKMTTKPQLEIYADDVKCSHGATVGSVDDNSLFYLRSRGIPKSEAQKMLIGGFIQDVVDKIKLPIIANKITELINLNLKY